MNWMSITGICFIIIGTVFSFLGTYKSDTDGQRELTSKIQEKNETIDNINDSNSKLIQQNTILLTSTNDVSSTNTKLILQNSTMLSKIERYQEDIESKENKIKELEELVKKAERGIISITQFDGSYLVKQGGSISVTSGTVENNIYKELLHLEKERKYGDMIRLCEQSIKDTPKWYTPYFYKAISLYNLNHQNKEEAIDILEYVIKNTHGDPQYVLRISNTYSQIGNQARADELHNSIPKEMIRAFQNINKGKSK